jgi:hypothetical protein
MTIALRNVRYDPKRTSLVRILTSPNQWVPGRGRRALALRAELEKVPAQMDN